MMQVMLQRIGIGGTGLCTVMPVKAQRTQGRLDQSLIDWLTIHQMPSQALPASCASATASTKVSSLAACRQTSNWFKCEDVYSRGSNGGRTVARRRD